MSIHEMLREPFVIRLLSSAVLVLAIAGARFLVVRRIRGDAHILNEAQRRQLFYLRTLVTAGLIIGLVIIWAGQLQNLVLSLTAVMVAVVIATKELLMCLSGFLMRATGRLFSVGDWIECNGLRGEVTDQTLLSTSLLELEPPEQGYGYTGRNLNLPNSMFLSHPVHTSQFARQYVMHRFLLTLAETTADPTAAAEWLRAEATRLCAPFLEEARRINETMDRRLGVDVAGPEPSVSVRTSELGNLQFRVWLFCPREQAKPLESELSGAFLSRLRAAEFG